MCEGSPTSSLGCRF